MDKTTLIFEKPGLLTTVQDLGRFNYQQFGVPIGGAMDKQSAKSANWLVGNPEEGPVLEITFMGPQISFDGDCQIALAGADLTAKINDQDVPMYKTLSVKSGSVLSFGPLKRGCRTYLAVGGKWGVTPWLESYSAAAFDAKNVTPESTIDQYSTLAVVPHSTEITPREVLERPRFRSSLNVRLFRGPEFDHFSAKEVGQFLGRIYQISPQSNRMGYLLTPGMSLEEERPELISSGIVPGTIQITTGGMPILLMADAQTTGGYPRIANVVYEDLDKLGQLKPGDKLSFTLVA